MTIVEQIAKNQRKTYLLFFGFFLIYALIGYIAALFWGEGAAAIVVVVALLIVTASLFFGDDMAVAVARGQKVESRQDAPVIWDTVETMAIAAGIQMPRIYISPDQSANAFAAGRNENQALICINQGLIKILDKDELAGVVAHEVAHIKNRDVKLMTYTAVLAGSITMLSYFISRMMIFGGGNRNGGGNVFVLIIALAAIILAPIAATIIQLAISRKREFLADAAAADLTRYPQGLASALEKISSSPKERDNSSKDAIAHMYISPLALEERGIRGKLFSTHPPTEERIARLLELSSGIRHENRT